VTLTPDLLGVPAGDDLNRIIEEQMREVKVAGHTYNFRPETNCRVCRNADLKDRVEDLLAAGTTYREILAIIYPQNSVRRRNDRISYHSIAKHATECFNISRAGALVYRRILERRAATQGLNFVKGTGHAVTIQAVLETVMVKGYSQITDDRIPISPELAISAGLQLHKMEAEEAGADRAAEMIAHIQRVIAVVNEVCTPEQICAIDAALAPDDDTIDVESWEDQEEDEEDVFDPTKDVDEVIQDDHEGF
jgi:hypothetical protein